MPDSSLDWETPANLQVGPNHYAGLCLWRGKQEDRAVGASCWEGGWGTGARNRGGGDTIWLGIDKRVWDNLETIFQFFRCN